MFNKLLLLLALFLGACRGPVMNVTSSPPGALVSVDGNYLGATPLRVRMRAANSMVTCEMQNYESQQRFVQFTGASPNVHFVMAKSHEGNAQQQQQMQMQGPTVVVAGGPQGTAPQVKEYGIVAVTGTDKAKVYLDGTLVGNIPLSGLRIEMGNHTLEVSMPGWRPWKESIMVLAGSNVSFVAELEQLPPSD